MVRIVVDSGCTMTTEMQNKDGINIEVAPLTLNLGDATFIDDENFDLAGYMVELKNYSGCPKTAAPSPEHFFKHFKGEGSAFGVTISSKLSGSYNSAMTAKDMYLEEFGQKCVHIFDSLSAGSGETLVALKINEFAKKNMPDLEIIENVTKFIAEMKTYFILDRYDTAVKTGRMNPYVAKIASLMSFVPICFADDGKMAVLDKARGYNKAIAKLVDIMAKDGVNFHEKTLGIVHVQAKQKAIDFKNLVAEKIKFKDIIILEATGLCATYADQSGLIIAF